MDKKTFKYASEFAIQMYLSRYQLLQQADLEICGKDFLKNHPPYHIYFILRRSKLKLGREYCIKNNNSIEFKYIIHEQNEEHERKLPITINAKEYDFHTEYPCNCLYVKKKNNPYSDRYKLAMLVDDYHKTSNEVEPLLDLEVLYIGQAFGENGERTAVDRLDSHSTLQKIYSETMQKKPDSEIWILLALFEQKNISIINGFTSMSQENKNDDFTRLVNFHNGANQLSEKQMINLTEAALIKTFLPKYNKEYKDTFPNPAHSSYSEYYHLDINSIDVEMDMAEARRWLYSDSKPRGINKDGLIMPYCQHAHFYFINDKNRYKLFNYEYLGTSK